MKKSTSLSIAKHGEILVFNILDDAELSHEDLNADLVWRGIKIGVKTAGESKKNRTAYNFNTGRHHKGIVYVFVGLTDGADSNYYWVFPTLKAEQKSTIYLKIADAVSAPELEETILRAVQRKKS